MQLSQILSTVEKRISSEQVYNRMFTLACVNHKKEAGRSISTLGGHCECQYCSAIYEFVRAKLWFRRLDREQDWNPRSLHGEIMDAAARRLLSAAEHKDMIKILCA